MKEPPLPPRKDIPSFWREETPNQTYLHLGEFPLGPTPKVLKAISQAAQNANRYPDTNAVRLRRKLADYIGHGIESKNILVGNGSDDLIDLAVITYVRPEMVVLTFEPSFFVYRFAGLRHGGQVFSVQRDSKFAIPESLDPSLNQLPIALSFIANPNNPTGTCMPRESLLSVLKKLSGMVVVDECYFEFCGETVVDQVKDNPRLIVFRSLSKSFGLSGLRLGYAIAHESVIERMERYAMTFPVNAIAQAAGIAALDDWPEYKKRIQDVVTWREDLQKQLQSLGLEVIASQTNFLLTLWPESAQAINPAQKLAEAGILVSDQTPAIGLSRPALRIAVGTPEENKRVVEEIRKLMVCLK